MTHRLLSTQLSRQALCRIRPCTFSISSARRRFSANVARSEFHNHQEENDDFVRKSREKILELALQEVHHHGWTVDAIATAVTKANITPTMTAMVTPEELVSHVMTRGNNYLRNELKQKQWKDDDDDESPQEERLVWCIQTRLKFIIPFLQSGIWHEAMALGATSNIWNTQQELHDLVELISQTVGETNFINKAAIGGLYAATELHLLTDTSIDYQDSWQFLNKTVKDLKSVQNFEMGGSDMAIASAAVATSLGSAILSLAQPAMRGTVASMASTIVPHLASFMTSSSTPPTQNDGTRPSDYDVKVKSDGHDHTQFSSNKDVNHKATGKETSN